VATREFMRTSYVTEESELEPINLDDDPIEIPSLQANGDCVPSQNVVGKSSKPRRKRRMHPWCLFKN